MKKQHCRLNFHICVLGAAAVIALLALFAELYAVRTIRTLQNALGDRMILEADNGTFYEED